MKNATIYSNQQKFQSTVGRSSQVFLLEVFALILAIWFNHATAMDKSVVLMQRVMLKKKQGYLKC